MGVYLSLHRYTNMKPKNTQLKFVRKTCFWHSVLRNKDKKLDFALKIGWRALAEREPSTLDSNWRSRRDSNP